MTPDDLDKTVSSSSRMPTTAERLIATLVMVQGPEIGQAYPLRRNRVVIGRAGDADIVIPHKQISRAHAAIETLRMGGENLYRIRDLGSTNRLFVNGTQVEVQILAEGDKIHLGDVVLRFEMQDAIDARFHSEIRDRIRYDDLTGLLTYASFQAALAAELDRAHVEGKGCGVVMMDLDDFKKLNDTYGHLAGSFVLSEVGALIRGNLRPFDVSSRYGGEEFVAYLPEAAADEAVTAADRLRQVFAERVFLHQERAIRLTISMGVSHFPQDGRQVEPLVQAADERLYRAKRLGKNRVES